jgi:hypothetical protein
MTFDQALRSVIHTGNWFRPVAWHDSGRALCVEGEKIQLVPSARGGTHALFPDVGDMLTEWEVVTSDEVNAE